MTDPIADMLTRIRNAVHARHQRVDVPASTVQGRHRADPRAGRLHPGIQDGRPTADAPQPVIRIFLKYGPRGETVISGLERVSRPGRRVYFGRDDVPRVMGGLGTSILTTSRGVMTGQDAVKAGVGGEVLCNIW